MKFNATLSIGLSGCVQSDIIEIDDDELAGLSGDELETAIHDAWTEWAWNYIDGGATPIEGSKVSL